MHSHKVIFNKTVTKHVTILTKCFFPYLNPTSYLNRKNCDFLKIFFLLINCQLSIFLFESRFRSIPWYFSDIATVDLAGST